MNKIILAGGSGYLGSLLARHFADKAQSIVILTRGAAWQRGNVQAVPWDGANPGPWQAHLEGADLLVNLAGKNVNCRYTEANLREMLESRVESTRVVGQAIAQAERPPRLWLQMSTATIYAHTFGEPNDERSGRLGGSEPDVPAYWKRSIDIATAWERTLHEADTPRTRKVALRTAMVMSAEPDGVFEVLLRLVRFGLGGAVGGGRQYVSWLHEEDFLRAVLFLMEHEELSGPINLAAPHPLPHRDFMASLRAAYGRRPGLPAARWMLEVGALVLRTDTELLLKSRRVVPGRLLETGFTFQFPTWPEAAADLTARWRRLDGGSTLRSA